MHEMCNTLSFVLVRKTLDSNLFKACFTKKTITFLSCYQSSLKENERPLKIISPLIDYPTFTLLPQKRNEYNEYTEGTFSNVSFVTGNHHQ